MTEAVGVFEKGGTALVFIFDRLAGGRVRVGGLQGGAVAKRGQRESFASQGAPRIYPFLPELRTLSASR